ncbi:MAG: MFS transporter [Thermodesulfobacteriota bacterium]
MTDDSSPRSTGPAPDRTMTRYHKFLIFILSVATFFEGYDYMVINLILPLLGKETGASAQTLGNMVAIINIGTIVAFFVIRLADRFGRRPILLLTIILYTGFTALTAFSRGLTDFTIYQFLARVFLVSEWGLAAVILAEELPAGVRGFGIAIVQCAAAFGAVLSAGLFPKLSTTAFGWRSLYLIGLIPLVLMTWLRRDLKETRRFLTARAEMAADRARARFFTVLTRPYLKRTVSLMALWWMSWVALTAVQVFWAYHAINERGWTLAAVSKAMTISYTIGLSGYLVCGKLMDRLGRRPTSLIFFLGGAAAIAWTFLETRTLPMYLAIGFCVFFITAYLPICSTYTTELFPTHLRANAAAWTNNTVGRTGCVIAPALVGQMALYLGGTGQAVAAIALCPLIGALLILLFFPETKQRELEEISK